MRKYCVDSLEGSDDNLVDGTTLEDIEQQIEQLFVVGELLAGGQQLEGGEQIDFSFALFSGYKVLYDQFDKSLGKSPVNNLSQKLSLYL